MQALIVNLIVLACGVHAAWRLMPAAARQAIARRVGRRPLPQEGACGGCSGCSAAPPASRQRAQVITIHRRIDR